MGRRARRRQHLRRAGALDRGGYAGRAPPRARRVHRVEPPRSRHVRAGRAGPGGRGAMKTEPRIEDWVGRTLDAGDGEVVVEEGYIRPWLEATENANPL